MDALGATLKEVLDYGIGTYSVDRRLIHPVRGTPEWRDLGLVRSRFYRLARNAGMRVSVRQVRRDAEGGENYLLVARVG